MKRVAGGEEAQPTAAAAEAAAEAEAAAAAEAAEEAATDDVRAGSSSHSPLRLAPLEICLLSDVSFPVPSHMTFEPDVLEACHCLRLRVSACIGVHRSVPLEVPCAFAPEAEVWKHYEQISPHFFIHHDNENE